VLVLDVADDLFDHVLDRDQALGPTEFVDDDRQMGPLRPHPRKKLDDPHRFRHEQGLAHERRQRTVLRLVKIGDEDVLDVDHADDLIEAFAIDGEAAVAGVGKGTHQVFEADAGLDRDNVAARHADVACGLFAEVLQVAQHLPLGRRQVARDRVGILGLVDRVLDLLAEGRLVVVAKDQMLDSAPDARSAFVVLPGGHQAFTP
jgi:hypothetical protein